LFERESVQRHSKKSGTAREEIASDVEGRVGAGCWWDGGNTSDTLTKCGANGAQRMPDKDNFGAVLQPIANALGSRGVRSHTELDGHGAYIPIASVAIQGSMIGRQDHNGPSGSGCSNYGEMFTLTTTDVHAVAQAMTVRRLTPRECERLQGFPDDYTLIPWRKKAAEDCPDGSRYKALGNSMAVNCMEWIGERIAAVDAKEDA
jgi:site-specific DNA-cytosine methylase